MKVKQIECTNGSTKRIVWTDQVSVLEAGKFAQFKGETIRWQINKVFDVCQDSQDINRSWHVGGL